MKDVRERVARVVMMLRSAGYEPVRYGEVVEIERAGWKVKGVRVESTGVTCTRDLGLCYGVKLERVGWIWLYPIEVESAAGLIYEQDPVRALDFLAGMYLRILEDFLRYAEDDDLEYAEACLIIADRAVALVKDPEGVLRSHSEENTQNPVTGMIPCVKSCISA